MASCVLQKVLTGSNKRRFFDPFVGVFYNKIGRCNLSVSNKDAVDSKIGTAEVTDVIKSPYAPVEIPNVSLPELLFEEFNNWPNHTAIVCSITKRQYTYEEIRLKSRNLAKSLKRKLKLQKNDTLAVLLPNVPEFPIVFLGGYQSGIIITTLNPLYTTEEISKQLIDSDAKAIITLNTLYDAARNGALHAKKDIPIVTIKNKASESTATGSINFSELTDAVYEKEDLQFPDPNDIALMPYSSGTTGLPKGVELTHRNIVANIVQVQYFNIFSPTTQTTQDVLPGLLPMFHIYGHTSVTLQSLHIGVKIVTLPNFTPELFTSVLQDFKPTILFAVPPIVNFLSSSPLVKKEYLQPIRCVFSGAAPLGPLDETKFIQKAEKDITIVQGYGLTETSPVVSLLSLERKNEINVSGSVGDPVPNTLVKIVSPDDTSRKHLKPYEQGELLVKGPQVMKGYHNKPQETANTIYGDWLRTGDLAYYDENNVIFICDRLKELIKVKGFQVAPAELEDLIRDHPDVADAAVIGIPDENYGEVPRAYIVPKKDAKIGAEKLNEYLAEKVTNYKLLRGGVSIVDSIPKNSTGKIVRRILKELYQQDKDKK